MLASFFMWEVSLTHPVLASFFYLGSFPQTSRAGFIFMWGVSLKHPGLASFLCREFFLHILSWLPFYAGSFSYTSRAGFLFYLGSFSYTSRAGFIFLWRVSLTHPMLAFFFFSFSFFPSFLNLGSFSYTSGAGFIFMQGVSLSHPVMALFLTWEFLLHIPRWPHFYAGCFSYTSYAGCIMWGVSLACSLEAGGCFTLVSYGCAYHTNCLLKKRKRFYIRLHISCWHLFQWNFFLKKKRKP